MGHAIAYALGYLFSGVMSVVLYQRARVMGRGSATVSTQLAPWASKCGFEVVDPLDLSVHEDGAAALMLAGADGHREIGAALRRRHARSVLYLFDTFRTDGRGQREVTCLLATSAVVRGVNRERLVVNLPGGSQIECGPGRIVLTVPRPLSEALGLDLTTRMTHLEASFAATPGAGRL